MASDPYLMTKISETLLRAGGDRKRAQEDLLEAAGHDPRLLSALVTPYLPSITTHVVNRVCDRAKFPERRQPALAHPRSVKDRPGGDRPMPIRADLSADDLDTIVGQLGSRIGSVPAPNGLEALLRPQSQPKASAQHAESIRRIAVAHARKRLDQSI